MQGRAAGMCHNAAPGPSIGLYLVLEERQHPMSRQAAIRPLVAGNWKMNGLRAALSEAMRVRDALESDQSRPPVDVMICPPATLVAQLAEAAAGTPLAVGAQDCHWLPSGAHTGDISAEMLKDSGASAV